MRLERSVQIEWALKESAVEAQAVLLLLELIQAYCLETCWGFAAKMV